MADDDTESGHPMTADERDRLIDLINSLLPPPDHTVQEVRPGVYMHTWGWRSALAEWIAEAGHGETTQ
jgi:hypothetical protein